MRETYLELFPVGTFGYPRGVFGVGLGVDAAGGIEALQSRWQAELGADQVALNPKLHAVDGVQVPWFRNLTLSWSDSSNYAAIWGMEYYPNPGSTKPHTRFEERAVRYAPHKLARNVSAAVYGVEAGDAALLRRTLSSAGWKVREEGAGFVSLSPRDAGVRRQLHFRIASADHLGLLGLKIQLNRYAQHTEQLGDAVCSRSAPTGGTRHTSGSSRPAPRSRISSTASARRATTTTPPTDRSPQTGSRAFSRMRSSTSITAVMPSRTEMGSQTWSYIVKPHAPFRVSEPICAIAHWKWPANT